MMLSRHDLIAGCGTAALAAALAAPARADAVRRGTVGMIKPSIAQGPIEEIIPFLPAGTAYVPVYLDFATGAKDEFANAMPTYEKLVALLADQKCDVIAAEGAPPFMIQGPRREAEIVSGWEKRYGVQIFTSSQNQVNALHALHVNRIVGATYLSDDNNRVFAKYFTDVGFTVLSMDGFKVSFAKVQDVPGAEILAYIRAAVRKQTRVEGIYMLGSGWRTLDIIEPLEKEFGVPVFHPVIVRAWEIQKRLKVRVPMTGYGRLMAELP